jgi:hypothetical protein
MARPGPAGLRTARQGMQWLGQVGHGMDRLGMAGHGLILTLSWTGGALRGAARLGEVRQSPARRPKAWNNFRVSQRIAGRGPAGPCMAGQRKARISP